MKKNKFSVKQNDGGEGKRWSKLFNEMVVTDMINYFYAIYLIETGAASGFEKKAVKTWARYLVEDMNSWKKGQVSE
jgi:hypothetical protein